MFKTYSSTSAKKISLAVALFLENDEGIRTPPFPRMNPFKQFKNNNVLLNKIYQGSGPKIIDNFPKDQNQDPYFDSFRWSKMMTEFLKPYYEISKTSSSDDISIDNLFIFIFYASQTRGINKILESNLNISSGWHGYKTMTGLDSDKLKWLFPLPEETEKLDTYKKHEFIQLFAEFLYKIPLILQPDNSTENIRIVNNGYYSPRHNQLKPFNQLIKAQALLKFIELLQFDVSSYFKNPSTNLVGPYVSFGPMPYCASLLILGTSKNRIFDFEAINAVGSSLAMADREYQSKILPNVQSLDDLLNPFSETTDIFLEQNDFINCLPNLFGDKTNKKRLVTDLYNYHNDPQAFIDQSLNNKSDFIFPEIMYLPAFIH